MTKGFDKIKILLVTLITLGAPIWLARAEGLVPCGQDLSNLCDPCDFLSLASGLINYILFIAPIIAGAFFVYAGILLLISGGNTATVQKVSKIFWNTVTGVVIMLSAWLLTNFVLKTIASNSDISSSWYKIECTQDLGLSGYPTGSDTGGTSSGGNTGGSTGGGSGEPYGTTSQVDQTGDADIPDSYRTSDDSESAHDDAPAEGSLPPGQPLTSDQARQQLTAAGVTAKKECVAGASRGCAKLDGVRQGTIDEVVALKRDCPSCNVNVTAGAESGHAKGTFSHTNGFKVDLSSKDGTVDNYVANSGNFTYVGVRRSDGAKLYQKKGSPNIVYARESDHWDISVKPK